MGNCCKNFAYYESIVDIENVDKTSVDITHLELNADCSDWKTNIISIYPDTNAITAELITKSIGVTPNKYAIYYSNLKRLSRSTGYKNIFDANSYEYTEGDAFYIYPIIPVTCIISDSTSKGDIITKDLDNINVNMYIDYIIEKRLNISVSSCKVFRWSKKNEYLVSRYVRSYEEESGKIVPNAIVFFMLVYLPYKIERELKSNASDTHSIMRSNETSNLSGIKFVPGDYLFVDIL